jgi:undecaprenyl-diphosphatase
MFSRNPERSLFMRAPVRRLNLPDVPVWIRHAVTAALLLLIPENSSAAQVVSDAVKPDSSAVQPEFDMGDGVELRSTQPSTGSLTLTEAVVLGLIEGATEYLPVSSTGHLLLYQRAAGMADSDTESEAANALAICIQLGAILAVVVLYFGRLRQMAVGMLGGNPNGLRLTIYLVIAFLPAAVIGLLFNDWVKSHLFGVGPVAVAQIVGGILILSLAGRLTAAVPGCELHEITWKQALGVGCMQCLAFWPGFSRSLATILGCMWSGMKLAAAVEFSFLLGLVTLTAATVYEGLKHGSAIVEHYGLLAPAVALITAFVSAVISVRFMVSLLSRRGLAPFGYYRLVLGAVCLFLLFSRS